MAVEQRSRLSKMQRNNKTKNKKKTNEETEKKMLKKVTFLKIFYIINTKLV